MRSKIILFMFNVSLVIYRKMIQKDPWCVTVSDLGVYPAGTLGFELKDFLQRNHFSLQDKLENHDVVHVLTGSGTTVPDEIGMQFYLLGNGKRSLYAYISIVSGLLLFPEKIKLFRQQFRSGKSAKPFHQVDFRNLLSCNTEQFRNKYAIQNVKPQ